MLQHLSIQNYALIEKLSLDFSSGFTVITGETGAGKSILLGALGLLLGNRADPNVLMDKHKKCIVEGTFNVDKLGLQHFFKANDLDFEELSILRREIIPSGRSRAFINDTPVKLDLLRKLGDQLVDIHSQHQTLMLNNSLFQLQVLDGFINQPELLDNYRQAFREYESLQKKLEQLIRENKAAKQDEDYIRFQHNELDTAHLNIEESDALIEKEKFLAHAEEVIREISLANQLLSENETSISSQLNETISGLQRIEKFFEPARQILERLEKLQIELKDIASETENTGSHLSFNPNELQLVTDQLDNLYRLQQKYGVHSVAELIEIRDDLAEKLENFVSLEEEIQAFTDKISLIEKEVNQLADGLHKSRKKFTPLFEKSITQVLMRLGMKDAGFYIKIERLVNLSLNGYDDIRFLFNANKGGTADEIARIASGGELSRLMLAIKSLVNKQNFLPTVVFDEIDAGVSGEIAGKVGNILKSMSDRHQLIVISHLPQIASKAHAHALVSKYVEAGVSHTKIDWLDAEGRVDEIAKMMSDEKVSQSAIATAKELLSQQA